MTVRTKMKCILIAMMCMLCFSGCVQVVETPENSTTVQETEKPETESEQKETEVVADPAVVYAAYAEKIEEYEEKYGTAKVEVVDEYFSYMKGLCFIQLIDFAKNGQEYLFLVYQTDNAQSSVGDYTFEIWGYENGGIQRMDSGGLFVTDGGVRHVYFTEVDGAVYLVTGAMDDDGKYEYHGLRNGKIEVVREVSWECDENGEKTCYIDNVKVSETEMQQQQDEWLKNLAECDLSYGTDLALEISGQVKQKLGIEEQKNTLEVSEYVGRFEELVSVLHMEGDQGIPVYAGVCYKNERFELEWDNSSGMFWIANDECEDVSVFGICLGMSKEEVAAEARRNGYLCIEQENGTNVVYALYGQEVICIYAEYQNDVVSFCSADNYESADTVEEIRNILLVKEQYDLKNKEPWKNAYIDFIYEKGVTWEEYLDEYLEDYKLVNVDGDQIPELYINFGSTAGGDMICTYANNRLVSQYLYNFGFSYIEGNNLFLDSGGHMDEYYDAVYSIENGQFVLKNRGEFGAKDNSQVQYDAQGAPIYDYYWNGTKISGEAEYETLLNAAFDSKRAIHPYKDAGGNYTDVGVFDYDEIIKQIAEY